MNGYRLTRAQNTISGAANNPLRPGPQMPRLPPSIAPRGDRLVLAGASVRSLAASAARAGFEVHAVDLFGDLDLRAIAASTALARPYPAGLPAAMAALPPAPWSYTGGLENHPDVIAAIAVERTLAGCPADAVSTVRDPVVLGHAIRRIGLGFPDTRPDPTDLPVDGSWLVKPRRSAGGHGILPWHGAARTEPGTGDADVVWQRRVAGHPAAACYKLAAGGATLVGCSRQLVGRRWCHAPACGYCGSVDLDPDSLDPAVRERLERLGGLLAERFSLVGLVGVDLIVDHRRGVHLIEVNPRPTASMELVERATGLSVAAEHLASCGIAVATTPTGWPRRGSWSKAVLFAPTDVVVDEASLAAVADAAGDPVDGWPPLADVPCPGQVIPAGRPVCSLFAHGPSPGRSLTRLRRRVAAVAGVLRHRGPR